MNEQNISLDVSKSASISQVVRIGQGDKSGTTIVASIYDNGATLSLSGKTARFNMRLPGGAGYVRDTACTVSGNNITYVVNEQYCASVVGITSEVYFEIMQGTSVIASTQRFSIQVLRSVLDGMKPAESWDNAIDELINRGNEKLDEIDESLITQASATIDDNVGTPNVSVSLSQRTPSTLGKLLSFAFHNIKGNTGATGPQGPKGDKGDTVSVEPITNSEIDTVASDGQLTSLHALDGTGLTYLWSKLKTKFASLVNGTVAVTQGGTGATSAAGARTNLGVPSTTDLANIESSMAYVEAVTAKKNHAVGDYFMLGDVLMRTTAAIAAGETIKASKATPATLQGQIDTLRDSVSVSSSALSSFVTNLTNVTLVQAQVTRYGRIVQVNIGFKSTAALSDGANVAVINSTSDRPLRDAQAQDGDKYHATIESNGNIKIRRAISSGTTFWVKAIYIAVD